MNKNLPQRDNQEGAAVLLGWPSWVHGPPGLMRIDDLVSYLSVCILVHVRMLLTTQDLLLFALELGIGQDP